MRTTEDMLSDVVTDKEMKEKEFPYRKLYIGSHDNGVDDAFIEQNCNSEMIRNRIDRIVFIIKGKRYEIYEPRDNLLNYMNYDKF